MKRIHSSTFLFLSVICFLISPLLSSGREIKEDNINVEPIEGSPNHYSVNIKFSRIDKVLIRTTLIAESSGQKKESYTLPEKEWHYNQDKNLLVVSRAVDNSKYIIRVAGRYETPISIIPDKKIDPSSIRLVVNGRIGIHNKDYRYNRKKNIIELTACQTGKEKYIVVYNYTGGGASIGSAGMSDLTLPLLKHINFPVEGNSLPSDQTGLRFSPVDVSFRHVWMVQLIPAGDGYTGEDLLSGFKWDQVKKELILDNPVDIKKYTLMIYGEVD